MLWHKEVFKSLTLYQLLLKYNKTLVKSNLEGEDWRDSTVHLISGTTYDSLNSSTSDPFAEPVVSTKTEINKKNFFWENLPIKWETLQISKVINKSFIKASSNVSYGKILISS